MGEPKGEDQFDARVARALDAIADEYFAEGYRLGCIVGAAIVAWGDAMRGRPGMTDWRCAACDYSNPEGSTVCDDCGAEWT